MLVEKNYLKSYDADGVLLDEEKKRILMAYHTFQKQHDIPESNEISIFELTALYRTTPKKEENDLVLKD